MVTNEEIVIADVCSCDVPFDRNVGDKFKITLAFLPLQSDNSSEIEEGIVSLDLRGTRSFEMFRNNIFEISSMHLLGDYLILIHFGQINDTETDIDYEILGLIAVHIPSRKELYFDLLDKVSLCPEEVSIEIPEFLCCSKKKDNTISCMNSIGMITTNFVAMQ